MFTGYWLISVKKKPSPVAIGESPARRPLTRVRVPLAPKPRRLNWDTPWRPFWLVESSEPALTVSVLSKSWGCPAPAASMLSVPRVWIGDGVSKSRFLRMLEPVTTTSSSSLS